MKNFTRLFILPGIVLFFLSPEAWSQTDDEYDSLLNYYLKKDSILLNEIEIQLAGDSLDIFDLIDSLINKDYRISQLTLRTGYTSDITYAGRNFGISQYGINAGLAYYHKTGLFADLSGYWNSDLNPSYNPTITTIGYMGNILTNWTYTLSYDHYFYTESKDELTWYPLTNSLNATSYYELWHFTLSADYSFLFGEQNAHRARLGLFYTFAKNNWGFIDRFVIMPTATILLGNAEIYQVTPVYPEMNLETRIEIRQIMFREYGEDFVRFLWRRHRDKYLRLEKLTYNQFQDELTDYVVTSDNVFGIMNYSFSIPVYLYINDFTVALSYNYNIPVALPGENLDLDPNSYVGVALLYNIPFRKKDK